MVGVPRSKGCRICVQRRVRCDLARPTCNNCRKGNRPCPGYDPDLKFQDEGERLRKRYATKNQSDKGQGLARPFTEVPPLDPYISSSSSASPESTPWLPNGETVELVSPDVLAPHRNEFFAFLESDKRFINKDESSLVKSANSQGDASTWGDYSRLIEFSDSHALVQIDAILLSPSIAQEALLHQLHASLAPSSQTSLLPPGLRNHGRWLAHLPSLTGRDHLVDTAVRAVSLAHLARLHNSDVFLHESRPYYGKAIRLLSSSLGDDERGMSSETLSATILLSFYEMFASDSNEAWIQHAGGGGALMKARGPARHRHGFDREIFLAFRHTVIIECFETDEVCFLGEPEWRDLSRQIQQDIRESGLDAGQIEFFDLTEDFYEEMLDLPTHLYEAKNFNTVWKKKRDQFPTIPDFIEGLVKRCQKSRAGLKSFYAKFRLSLTKIGFDITTLVSGDPIVPIFYHYPNIMVASTCTGYWTVLIILNFCLIELERSNPGRAALYKVENRECGLEICRSTSFLLTSSFLGPFFNIQGLRVCLLAFQQPDEREWVIQKLFEIGKTHMGMASHIPGFHPGDGEITVRQRAREWDQLPTLEDLRGN